MRLEALLLEETVDFVLVLAIQVDPFAVLDVQFRIVTLLPLDVKILVLLVLVGVKPFFQRAVRALVESSARAGVDGTRRPWFRTFRTRGEHVAFSLLAVPILAALSDAGPYPRARCHYAGYLEGSYILIKNRYTQQQAQGDQTLRQAIEHAAPRPGRHLNY